jgi:N-acetylmuramoyl-L-alanine amidase
VGATIKQYPVRNGDCMATIAEQYGYWWKTLWDHPANKELRDRRENPNTLLPVEGYAAVLPYAGPVVGDKIQGDENGALHREIDYVSIPDKDEKKIPAATDATHEYQLKRNQVQLKLQLLDNGAPIASARYKLKLSGAPLDDAEQTAKAYKDIDGTTDANGMIDRPIPVQAYTAELLFPASGRRYHLILGGLHPYDTISGAQARLRNLGYLLDEVDGELRTSMRVALAAFQRRKGLRVTGEIDPVTLRALRDAHDGTG